MLKPNASRWSSHHVRAVKADDMKDHVAILHAIDVSPHVARNKSPTKTGELRRSAIDGRTTQYQSYGEEAMP